MHDDELLFADEHPPAATPETEHPPWNILIIDDDEEVFSIRKDDDSLAVFPRLFRCSLFSLFPLLFLSLSLFILLFQIFYFLSLFLLFRSKEKNFESFKI